MSQEENITTQDAQGEADIEIDMDELEKAISEGGIDISAGDMYIPSEPEFTKKQYILIIAIDLILLLLLGKRQFKSNKALKRAQKERKRRLKHKKKELRMRQELRKHTFTQMKENVEYIKMYVDYVKNIFGTKNKAGRHNK